MGGNPRAAVSADPPCRPTIRAGRPMVFRAGATDTGSDACNEAPQRHGGYGYLRDFGGHQILEGTDEIMRAIVARRLSAGI